METAAPTVCVWMITFNHESYIAQAIQSVLDQICTFPVMLHIADDCSTDNTAFICGQFALEHPEQVRLIRREKNIGMATNAIQTLSECLDYQSPYIALLEGDDFWTDPFKLQKQVDAIAENKDAVLVFTDAKKLTNKGLVNYYSDHKPLNTFGLALFLSQNLRIPTCTVLLTSKVVQEVVSIYPRNSMLFHIDYLIWCVAGKLGHYLFVDSPTATYRVLTTGAVRSTSHQDTLLKGMRMNKFLAGYMNSPYDKHFKENNWWYYLEYAFLEIRNGNYLASNLWFLRSVFDSLLHGRKNQLQITRDYIYRLRLGCHTSSRK